MSELVNILMILAIVLALVFMVVAITFIIVYYTKAIGEMLKKPKTTSYDARPIIEQLDEAIGGKNNGDKR